MTEQTGNQSWIRGAVVIGGVVAAFLFILNRPSQKAAPAGAVEAATDAAGTAVDAVSSTASPVAQAVATNPLVRSGNRLLGLLLANVADDAVAGVKGNLKSLIQQADAIVDQM